MPSPPSACDVIVVGAGPAGAVAAMSAAAQGLTTILFEKETLPRTKVCAGGVQVRTLLDLPFEISDVVEVECSGIAFTQNFSNGFVRRADFPIVFQVERKKFDYFLVQKALGAGAHVLDNCAVTKAESNTSSVRVETVRGESYTAKFVIFADGAASLGYKLLNSKECRFIQLGVEYDIPKSSSLGTYDSTLVSVEWGTMPDGYGWIFPKREHLVIGCDGPHNQMQSLKTYLQAFAKALGFSANDCTNLRAHMIPSLTREVVLANERLVLAGDAGGFAEPFSGEGISYAVKSGRLAAQAVFAAATNGASLAIVYRSSVNSIRDEILALQQMKQFFALVPSHVHRLYMKNDRVWEEFSKALVGKNPATVVRDNAPFSSLWPLVDAVAGFAYRRFLKRRINYEPDYFEQILSKKGAPRHPAFI